MPSKIRAVKNINLDVTHEDGSVETQSFSYGRYYPAKLIEILMDDPEYTNIILEDDSRIDGVSRHVFENFGTPIKRILPTPTPLVKHVSLQESTPKKKMKKKKTLPDLVDEKKNVENNPQ